MKINFGDYFYYDPTDGDNNTYSGTSNIRVGDELVSQKAFDKDKFQEYLNKKQYKEAYKYAKNYHFVDEEKQKRNELLLKNLRDEGLIAEQVYSRIPENDREAVDFADMVGVNNGLELIPKNQFTKEFIKLKEELGGEGSTALKIKFDKKQRSLFGWDVLDFLKKDNEYGYEDYLKDLNIDETTLRKAGVNITIDKDGSTSLLFDKSNPYANKLIYAVPHRAISGKVWDTIQGYDSMLANIGHSQYIPDSGYTMVKNLIASPLHRQLLGRTDVNGKSIGDNAEFGIHITGLKRITDGDGDVDKFEEVSTSNHGDWTLRRIKSLIKGAKETKDQYANALNFGEKQYSSTIGPSLNIDLDESDMEGMNQNEYARMAKLSNAKWESFLKTAGWQNYQIFTNYNNDSPEDTKLVKLASEAEKEDLMSKLAADAKNVQKNVFISNGKVGILFTLDRVKKEAKNLFELSSERRVQVFIPDDGRSSIFNEVREKVASDPRIAAVDEINKMQDWGYTKELYGDEGTLEYIGVNQNTNEAEFMYTRGGISNKISKDKAQQIITRNNFVEHFSDNIIHQFVTSDGRLVSTPENPNGGALAYEELTRQAALTTATNLYPNVPWTYANGKPIEQDELNKFLWEDDTNFREAWLDNFNEEQQRMLLDMLHAYKMMFLKLGTYGIYNVEQLGLR